MTNAITKTVHPLSPIIGLMTMVVGVGLQIIAMRPTPPKPEDAPTNEFSAARALVLVGHLLGDGAPHPIGAEANIQVRNRILNEFDLLGYTVNFQIRRL
jgi:hypothetical protein